MPVINQQAAADTYAATAAKIEGVYRSRGGWFSVGSFPAFLQLQYALPGQGTGYGSAEWKDEELVGAGAFGFIPQDAIGIRFRNQSPGSAAIITVSLAQGPEPALAISALGVVSTSGRAPTRTVITALGAGTYNTPTSAVAILVELLGGGGGGGGSRDTGGGQASTGGGGSGASYANKLIAAPATSYAYVLGDGGAGGAGHAGSPGDGGSNGVDTTLGGAVVVAKGGGGGGGGTVYVPPAFSGSGGLPQAGSIGDYVLLGGDGGLGMALNTNSLQGGHGGMSHLGAVQFNQFAGDGGSNSQGFGNGGPGGATVGGIGIGFAGAKGAPGLIIITEFY